MIPVQDFGKILIFVGTFIIITGLLISFGGKIPLIGRLPGDIVIQRKNYTFYFPLTTLIVLNLIIYFIMTFFKK